MTDEEFEKTDLMRFDRDILTSISNLIGFHRKEVVLTCPEDCWCWDVERIVEKHLLKMEK